MKNENERMSTTESVVLDLQMFASYSSPLDNSMVGTASQQNEGTGTGVGNVYGLPVEMKTFYDKVLLEAAKSKLVFEQFAQRRPIPPNHGKTIEFRRFGNLPQVKTALVEGVTPAAQVLEVTAVEAHLAQYGSFVRLTDWLQMTAIDPVLSQTVKLQGYQAGQTRDIVAKSTLMGTSNVMYVPKTVVMEDGTTVRQSIERDEDMDSTCKLTVQDIQLAIAKMKANNIQPLEDGCYVAIIHPYAAYDLKQDPRFDDWHKYSDAKTLYNGEIGKIDNCRFVETPTADISRPATLDDSNQLIYLDTHGVHHTLILGEGAYAVSDIEGGIETIIKQLGAGDDPLNQRSTAGWKTNMAAVLLNVQAALDVQSYAPAANVNEATGGYA